MSAWPKCAAHTNGDHPRSTSGASAGAPHSRSTLWYCRCGGSAHEKNSIRINILKKRRQGESESVSLICPARHTSKLWLRKSLFVQNCRARTSIKTCACTHGNILTEQQSAWPACAASNRGVQPPALIWLALARISAPSETRNLAMSERPDALAQWRAVQPLW